MQKKKGKNKSESKQKCCLVQKLWVRALRACAHRHLSTTGSKQSVLTAARRNRLCLRHPPLSHSFFSVSFPSPFLSFPFLMVSKEPSSPFFLFSLYKQIMKKWLIIKGNCKQQINCDLHCLSVSVCICVCLCMCGKIPSGFQPSPSESASESVNSERRQLNAHMLKVQELNKVLHLYCSVIQSYSGPKKFVHA